MCQEPVEWSHWRVTSSKLDKRWTGGIRMLDPILVSIAAALAGKGATGLYELVKKKFAADLRAIWGHVLTQQRADNGGVVNGITGTVTGNVLQARDIEGGVSF